MNLLKQVAFNIYLAMLLTFWFLMNLIVKPLAWIFYNTIRLISGINISYLIEVVNLSWCSIHTVYDKQAIQISIRL